MFTIHSFLIDYLDFLEASCLAGIPKLTHIHICVSKTL